MRHLFIIIALVVKFTLCHCQEYAQNTILNYKANNIHNQMNSNKPAPRVKYENICERVEYEFASEIHHTNQLLVNLNLERSSNLPIIDVLSTNIFMNIDPAAQTISMKGKNELILYLNEVRLQVSTFQIFQLLNTMKTSNVKTIEVINMPEYRSNFSSSTGIIKIRKK